MVPSFEIAFAPKHNCKLYQIYHRGCFSESQMMRCFCFTKMLANLPHSVKASFGTKNCVHLLTRKCESQIYKIRGQSYKDSTILIYDSRVVPDLKIPPYYDSRIVNYERKLFIRLATGESR